MLTPPRNVARGLTLVELIVVLLVILMLAALFVPVLRTGVREAGRRTSCTCSAKNVGLAAIIFETSRARFPGYLENVGANEREIPWLVTLMPYLECNDIYDSWVNAPEPKRPYVKFLRCASDPPINKDADFNSYVCNAGLIIQDNDGNYLDDNQIANGVFMDLRKDPRARFIASKDIVDGISNTLLISENLLAGPWGDVNSVSAPSSLANKTKLTTTFCWFDTKQPTADMRLNGNRATAKKLTPERLRPSSNHPGGAVVGFADGHTQFLKESIDYHVYKQLMTPNNDESSNSEKDYVLRSLDYE